MGAVFGCRQSQVTGHGRAPGDVPFVSDATIVRYSESAKRLGIQFLYLLNGLCTDLDLAEPAVRRRVDEDLDWIIGEVQPAGIVVADPRLAHCIRDRFGADRVAIRVSTIAGIRRAEELEPWLAYDIDGVVLHHDANRDWDALRQIRVWLERRAPNVRVELLLNEACVPACVARQAHYRRLARANLDYAEGFQQNCNIPRFLDPSYILSANWIRPEDLGVYHELGVRRFKIAGREMPGWWIDRAVAAYLSGKYEGNLLNLLTMTPPGLDAAASEIVFLSNSALEGFLARLMVERNIPRNFYSRRAMSLWRDGALRISDPGSEYRLEGERVRCVRPGRHLQRLIRLRTQSDPPFRAPRAGMSPVSEVPRLTR